MHKFVTNSEHRPNETPSTRLIKIPLETDFYPGLRKHVSIPSSGRLKNNGCKRGYYARKTFRRSILYIWPIYIYIWLTVDSDLGRLRPDIVLNRMVPVWPPIVCWINLNCNCPGSIVDTSTRLEAHRDLTLISASGWAQFRNKPIFYKSKPSISELVC